jgi:hypothetical protein
MLKIRIKSDLKMPRCKVMGDLIPDSEEVFHRIDTDDEFRLAYEYQVKGDVKDEIDAKLMLKYVHIVNILPGIFRECGIAHAWREIEVPDYDDLDVNRIGVSWSFTERGAESRWGTGDSKSVIVEAEVTFGDVDFLGTIAAYMVFDHEDELRLKRGRKIRLVKISFKDEEGEKAREDEEVSSAAWT